MRVGHAVPAGGGSTRMFVVLAAFILGSLIGTAHTSWWTALPTWPATSIVTVYGAWIALAGSLAAFGAIAWLTVLLERRRHGHLVAAVPIAAARWARGPWPLLAGAIGLAVVNIATLLIAGRPWGVTSALALWGAKIAAAFGVPVETWPYWKVPAQAAALQANVLTDVTTVMNVGIMLGALMAALLAGRFSPAWRVPARSLAAAIIGGVLLGYGARVAYGCNIGAYFSGIASGSLHGWLWLPAAFAGNIARHVPAPDVRPVGRTHSFVLLTPQKHEVHEGHEGHEGFFQSTALFRRHEPLQLLGPVLHDDDARRRSGPIGSAFFDHQEPLAVG